jgi:uncharacterized protein
MKSIIRMCICCRKKIVRLELLRLQFKDNDLIIFKNSGRSFYICFNCIKGISAINEIQQKSLEIKIKNLLSKEAKNKKNYIFQLKEIVEHVG